MLAGLSTGRPASRLFSTVQDHRVTASAWTEQNYRPARWKVTLLEYLFWREGVMKLIEIVVHEATVRLLYGDHFTKEESTEWMEMQVKAKGDDNRRLGVIQVDALRRLQTLIRGEAERLEKLAEQSRGVI
jgi:hypothetical protein